MSYKPSFIVGSIAAILLVIAYVLISFASSYKELCSRGEPINSEAQKMRIERSDSNISWDAAAALFHDVGWGQRQPSEIHAAFDRSSIKTFAFEGSDLIGFGRAIDDSRYYATIVDVVVSPKHQRKGVGRTILEDLHRQLDGFIIVTLTALPEAQSFYQRLGWRKLTTGMIRPRSEEQARLFCGDSN